MLQERLRCIIEENVIEFDMSMEDAIRDGIEQLNVQENKNGIVTNPNRYELVNGQVVLKLSKVEMEVNNVLALTDTKDIKKSLNTLLFEMNQVYVMSMVQFVEKCSQWMYEEDLLVSAGNALIRYSKSNGNEELVNVVSEDMVQYWWGLVDIEPKLVYGLLHLCCTKNERNKQLVFQYFKYPKDDEFVYCYQVAKLIKTLTTHDDSAVEFSKVLERVKHFVDQKWIIPYAMKVFDVKESLPDVTVQWVLVLKQLAVIEDGCLAIASFDMEVKRIIEWMEKYVDHVLLMKSIIALLRNLVTVDALKMNIVQQLHGMVHVIQTMQHHQKDRGVQEQGCAMIATAALRHPEVCVYIMSNNAAGAIGLAIRTHQQDFKLLRQASLAIRNIVARSPELREPFYHENIEPVLRIAQSQRACGDEAYAALRDLGCDIQYYEKKGSANFNPTIKQSNQLHQSIQHVAKPPFA